MNEETYFGKINKHINYINILYDLNKNNDTTYILY